MIVHELLRRKKCKKPICHNLLVYFDLNFLRSFRGWVFVLTKTVFIGKSFRGWVFVLAKMVFIGKSFTGWVFVLAKMVFTNSILEACQSLTILV